MTYKKKLNNFFVSFISLSTGATATYYKAHFLQEIGKFLDVCKNVPPIEKKKYLPQHLMLSIPHYPLLIEIFSIFYPQSTNNLFNSEQRLFCMWSFVENKAASWIIAHFNYLFDNRSQVPHLPSFLNMFASAIRRGLLCITKQYMSRSKFSGTSNVFPRGLPNSPFKWNNHNCNIIMVLPSVPLRYVQ